MTVYAHSQNTTSDGPIPYVIVADISVSVEPPPRKLGEEGVCHVAEEGDHADCRTTEVQRDAELLHGSKIDAFHAEIDEGKNEGHGNAESGMALCGKKHSRENSGEEQIDAESF